MGLDIHIYLLSLLLRSLEVFLDVREIRINAPGVDNHEVQVVHLLGDDSVVENSSLIVRELGQAGLVRLQSFDVGGNQAFEEISGIVTAET